MSVLSLFIVLMGSCLFIIPAGYAQFPEFSINKGVEDKQTADYAFETRNYYQAIEYYTKIFALESNNAEVVNGLAECYERLNDYTNAEIWYKISLKLNLSKFPLSEYKYSMLLKRNNKYAESIKYFEHFLKEYKGEYAIQYQQYAQNEIEGSRYAMEIMKDTQRVQIYNLGVPINSQNDDFAPLAFSNSLVFSSYRADKKPTVEGEYKNQTKTQLYLSQNQEMTWNIPIEFNVTSFSKPGTHACNGSLSPDGSRFYFTFCKEDANNATLCEIYVSRKNNESWSNPVKLDDYINEPNANNTQPCISYLKDNVEVLFFSSNRDRGYGGYDIWYCLVKNGTDYGEVKNVFDNINTAGDEITPFFDSFSQTLFFSSNGLPGLGGYDIYSSLKSGKFWVKAQNIGYPVNTNANDTYYTLSGKPGAGYLCSNREGSFLNNGNSCCMDIYGFQWEDSSQFVYHGNNQVAPQKETISEWVDLEKKIINKTYILKNVYFEYDKTVMLPGSEKDIDLLFQFLKENQDIKVEISAHSDSKGDDDYNTELSQRRAQIVVNNLIDKGIERGKMIAKGYGETQPIAPNENPDGTDNPEGRQMNRRVEFKVIEKVIEEVK